MDASTPPPDGGVVHCLPEAYRGAPVLSLPEHGVNVFRAAGCDHYFIELVGDGGSRTEAEVQSLRGTYDPTLLAISGVVALGTSLCCPKTGNAVCYEVDVQTHTTSLAELAERAATVFAAERHRCLTLRVSLIGAEQPRCDAGEPTCLPVPMCEQVSPPCCAVLSPFDAGAQRTPVGLTMLSAGSCAHDGECVTLGAGNHCMAWTVPGFFAPGICYPDLSAAYCGCVSGHCSWYEQR